jgi:translocation and assembly module TamB
VKSKKIIIWAIAGAILLVVAGVAVTAALLVKQSPSFRQGLLARAERNIYESTGARVAVRDFSLSFFPLHLDLYGVVAQGSEPQFGEPLLRADHVGAGIEIVSLRGRRWTLSDVVIDRPVVHLFVNQAAESNLPQPEAGGRSKLSIIALTVRELRLHGGEVDSNQQRILLDADLHDLHSSLAFDGGMKRYRGALNYAEGTLTYDRYAPVSHSLELSFDAAPAKLTVDHLLLVAGKSRVAATGSVENYDHPAVQATYDAHLSTSEVAAVLQDVSLPAGVVHLVGSLSYRRDPSRPVLETIALSGTVGSPELAVTMSGLHTQVSDFGAQYKLAAGNAELDNIHAQVFAGKMTGSLAVHELAGAAAAKFQARLKDASLAELQFAEHQALPPDAQLSGRINADVEATWSKVLEDLAARANVTLAGALGRNPATRLSGVIHADYVAANQQFTLRQSFVRTAQTSVTLDGSVSEQSQLQVSLRSGNLHEVELLAQNFRIAPSGQSLPSLNLYGTASFTGSVSGSSVAPHLKGQLEATDLRVRGTRWKLLRTDIDASPSSLSFSNGSLEAASESPEKPQRPEPQAATMARSEGQMSPPRPVK